MDGGVDAIVVRTFGGPEVLRLERVPVPAYTSGEVLVEVVAAGVNPVGVSNHEDAASVPLAAGTAYEVIVTHLQVTAGERGVIVGAAGGVGGFATQLAATRGARVIAVSRARTHTYVRAGRRPRHRPRRR